jgi:hypothetical protein
MYLFMAESGYYSDIHNESSLHFYIIQALCERHAGALHLAKLREKVNGT